MNDANGILPVSLWSWQTPLHHRDTGRNRGPKCPLVLSSGHIRKQLISQIRFRSRAGFVLRRVADAVDERLRDKK